MAKIAGGHLVAKYMKTVENIRMVFTLSGGHIESILDGFTEYNIKTIDVRHEQAAAMMAHAWSIYTGERRMPGNCRSGFYQCPDRHCKCLPRQCAAGGSLRQTSPAG